MPGRRDDRQADADVQPDTPGGHHPGTDRDHFWSGGAEVSRATAASPARPTLLALIVWSAPPRVSVVHVLRTWTTRGRRSGEYMEKEWYALVCRLVVTV